MTKHKDTHQPSQAHSQHEKKSAEGNAVLSKNKEIKKLIDMGVQRGYLTFIEVNELLPPEIITPDALDEVMNLLAESEIEVIDSLKRSKGDEEGDEESDDTPLGMAARRADHFPQPQCALFR